MGTMVSHAQSDQNDTLRSRVLDPVVIQGLKDGEHFLPDVSGMNVMSGKKTESITIETGEGNLSQNVGRMVFARIPGINVWDMDGAGTQMNIGTRGTDAHRAIEMNMRQNGYNTNSDMFGYPENHYTVPMQGVRQVQMVRGSAALQFGSQFGGMMNYIMKEGDSTKAFSIESEQTFGSYNFFNSYNAIGGTKGKVSYYAYYDNRHGDGWRPNAAYNYEAYYANIKYRFSPKGSLALQFSRMDYRQQIAGGLTDDQFRQDARESNRTRNFFSPILNIPALIFETEITPRTKLQIISHAIWGERSSVQFINTANVNDTINTDTGSFNPRQVDRDFYSGFTTEAKILHRYSVGKTRGALTGGVRYFDEHTKRRQKGVGTTASDFDFSLIGSYGIDLRFETLNYAAFVENVFWLTNKFSVTPGLRYEVIESRLNGVIDNASFPVSYSGKRSFVLAGSGFQYQSGKETQVYANISQAYRPYLYSFITPATQIGVIDPDLKDSKGYDIDIGFRGRWRNILSFDVNAFYLFYGDRIGKVLTSTDVLLTTNIGDSEAKGFELYGDLSLTRLLDGDAGKANVSLFNSLAYTHARYTSGSISGGTENISLVGNRVEGSPDWINRIGLKLTTPHFNTTLLVNHISRQFNDANNTALSATGIVGAVPAYSLLDWAFKWAIMDHYYISGGVNNVADERYFSRRINTYPGPGILPGEGRTFYVSLGFKL